MGTVLVPLPACDFDPSEVAVSWRVLRRLGHRVRFATPDATVARADDVMVTGRGLDPWGAVPGLDRLVLVGRMLRANAAARDDYAALLDDPEFSAPSNWDAIDLEGVDGLLLPGGHRARGMRPYLESTGLQRVVVDAFRRDLPVAAICHGVLLVARSVDPATRRSVLYGRRTTALTWALEGRAWQLARVTRFWDPDYYRTYREGHGQPKGYMSVQQEVTRALKQPSDFVDVEPTDRDRRLKSSGRARDSFDDARPALVVCDGNYLSARWPGDVHTFAREFAGMLGGAT
ncbi:thiJ/pfpI-family protein [Rhodococcus spelaei]|uniref:ThiJ/pfpI-family protein n=1 Tax=Rhodococcus spelaei TaxID=2546320 RepID=A0A541B422_9NOCA|nr:type 1 glutamine amidotransferase domain-containing protein [Rhodococcus spelaei]TQF67059.1 thiJ/pfpI-family protein [Rhodococcus spelaei]